MNAKIKSLLLIGLTLLIGFGAGFVANGWYVRQRLEKARTLVQDPDRFMERMEDDLGLDAATRATIRPLLRDHHKRMRALSRDFREGVQAEMDNLRSELTPHLTEAQIEALSKRLMMRRGPARGRPQGGPPAPGHPHSPMPPPGGPPMD